MDDIFGLGETVSPETSGQTDKNIDNSTPDTTGQVENSTGEAEHQEEQQQTELPKLLCGKFKTEGELKKSFNNLARKIEVEKGWAPGTVKISEDPEGDYENLQSYYTMMRQQASQTQQAPKEEYPAENEDALVAQWYQQAMQINPVEANKQIAEYYMQKQAEQLKQQFQPQTEEMQRMQALNAAAQKYSDFDQYAEGLQEQISNMAENEPELLDAPNWAEIAYMRAKISALEQQSKTAFDNGKKAAVDDRNVKKKVNNEIVKPNDGNQGEHYDFEDYSKYNGLLW